MSTRKKLFICLAIVFILVIIISTLINKSTKAVLETYTLNRQGLLRNDNIVLDEKFDDKGNLTYYKYKSPENGATLESNYQYEYDDENRIVKASLDDNDYIQMEYDDNNRLSKIFESIQDSASNGRVFLEFSFNHLDNNEIAVDKEISYSKSDENEYESNSEQHYTLNYKTINHDNKECILLTEKEGEKIVSEILYEKGSINMDYSNFYNFMNIVPFGYYAGDNSFKNSTVRENSLLVATPVLFNGNVIYIKNSIQGNPNSDYKDMGANNYYDKQNRLLKLETYGYETNQTINCMYKSLNSKEYYEYSLVKVYSASSTKYSYVQRKIYLGDDGRICKKEILKSDDIDEKEYKSRLREFEEYFEKENM